MSKFDRKSKEGGLTATLMSPVRAVQRALTHEGGRGYSRDVKSELFLLAVTNMVAEDSFYESGDVRDARFRSLLHAAVAEDPEWVARFVPWLRGSANMRSASVVAAVEYVRAGGPFGRRVVNSALLRADEPAEVLAYFTSNYGRAVPQPIKRGVADAAQRLYTERAALKYDGRTRAWRMADVLELTHVKPVDQAQSDLFRYLLDRRHDRDNVLVGDSLSMLQANDSLQSLSVDARRALVNEAAIDPSVARRLKDAGMTWEALSGWLDGPMDRAAWEAVIPSMGYMALLRNLRNFDQAGVDDDVAASVAAKLADPAEVAASRQFPYRFVAAFEHAPSLRWGYALEKALEQATGNVPVFPGRTLVLVDTSASMNWAAFSARSTMTPVKAAAVFGAVMAKRGNSVDLYGFADGVFRHRVDPAASVLNVVDRFVGRVGEVGHGTRIAESVNATYRDHDRVVIVSDMQTFSGSIDRAGPAVGAGLRVQSQRVRAHCDPVRLQQSPRVRWTQRRDVCDVESAGVAAVGQLAVLMERGLGLTSGPSFTPVARRGTGILVQRSRRGQFLGEPRRFPGRWPVPTLTPHRCRACVHGCHARRRRTLELGPLAGFRRKHR